MDQIYNYSAGSDTQNNEDNNAGIDIGRLIVMDQFERSAPPNAQVDITMAEAEDEDMPSLEDVSDSSDSEGEYDGDTSAVEMCNLDGDSVSHVHPLFETSNVSNSSSFSVTPPSIPNSTTTASVSSQRSNRRTRVDDDDDDERDRRHPSQRISSADSTPIPPSQIPTHQFATVIDFSEQPNNTSEDNNIPSDVSSDNNTNVTPDNQGAQSQFQAQGQQQNRDGHNTDRPSIQVFDYEFSILLDGQRQNQPSQQGTRQQGGSESTPETNRQAQTAPHTPNVADSATGAAPATGIPFPFPNLANFATLLGMGALGFGPPQDEKEDPERARKLVDGLEEVPAGLVRRLVRVGAGRGGMGEEEGKGGDGGCAVCWDRLLLEDEEQLSGEELNEKGDNKVVEEEKSKTTAASTRPRIVSLPCAHVFHAECLIPWFSRPKHTTCPTCRFNIDPDNLTYVSARRRRQETERRQREEAGNGQATDAPTDATTDAHLAPPDVTTTEDAAEQTQQQGEHPAPILGNGFAGILQFLNAHTQPEPAAPNTGNAHTAGQPAGQDGQPAANMLDNLFGQMVMPTTGAAGNAQGDSIARLGVRRITNVTTSSPVSLVIPLGGLAPMPWGFVMGDSIPVNTAQGNPNVPQVPPAANTNAPDGIQQDGPGGSHPLRQPAIVADILRVTVDMVFDGPPPLLPLRRPAQAAQTVLPEGHNNDGDSARRQQPQNATDGQPNDETASQDLRSDLPDLVERETAEGDRRFEQFLNFITGDRRSRNAPPSNTDANVPGHPPTDTNEGREPPPPQPEQARPHQPEAQPTQGRFPFGFSMGGVRVASGSGSSVAEAFTQMFADFQQRVHQPGGQNQPDPGPAGDNDAPAPTPVQPHPEPAGANDAPAPTPVQPHPEPAGDNGAPVPTPVQPQPTPPQEPQPQAHRPWQFVPIPMDFAFSMRPPQPEGPKRPWVLPPAPGPTLRQRIERREREAGLRCHDVSCGLGPSDEDPFGGDVSEVLCHMPQLSIQKEKNLEGARKAVCEHKLHSACLVSAERIALRGMDAVVGDNGCVEVSCPVCRSVGCVTKEEWEEGVGALL